MKILVWIILIWFVWFFIGCAVFAAIDDEEEQLYEWASSCPLPFGFELTVTMWPVVLWAWLKYHGDKS